MKAVAHAIGAVLVVAMGLLGLHFNVDYSGWVLLIGCLWVMSL